MDRTWLLNGMMRDSFSKKFRQYVLETFSNQDSVTFEFLCLNLCVLHVADPCEPLHLLYPLLAFFHKLFFLQIINEDQLRWVLE